MKNVVSRRLRRGFTLVELTVVILIIGIVATIAAPRFFDSVGTAKNKSSAQTIEVLRDATLGEAGGDLLDVVQPVIRRAGALEPDQLLRLTHAIRHLLWNEDEPVATRIDRVGDATD